MMLTGNKLETTISISLSRLLVTHSSKLMHIQENDLADGREATLEALLIMTTEASTINTQNSNKTADACLLLLLLL